jgi:hypothetical protein
MAWNKPLNLCLSTVNPVTYFFKNNQIQIACILFGKLFMNKRD